MQRGSRTIDSYVHQAPLSYQQPDITPPDPDGDPTRWRERPCFYVSVVDGARFRFLAGPFYHHQQALDLVPTVRKLAETCDPKSVFYGFGTSKAQSGERLGILNDRLGIKILKKGDDMQDTPIRPQISQDRWAMSETDLKNPYECSSNDMLLATGPGVPERGVYVYRHGLATNQYGDGSTGVQRKHAKAAESIETLTHEIEGQECEPTVRWVNVWIDDQSRFAGFVLGVDREDG